MRARVGLTLQELIIALTVIFLFVGTMGAFLHRTAIVGKEIALRTDLKNVRQSLVLYKAINKRYPKDLKELTQAKYRAKSSADEVFFGKQFLTTVGKDTESYPIDTFGNRFGYDEEKGVVYSTTEGYENW